MHSFPSPLSPPHTTITPIDSNRQQSIADISTFPSHSHRIARSSSKHTGRPKRGTREAPPRDRNNGCRRNRRLNREHRSTFQDLQASRRTSTNESARSNSGFIDYERGHSIFPRPRIRCSPLLTFELINRPSKSALHPAVIPYYIILDSQHSAALAAHREQ